MAVDIIKELMKGNIDFLVNLSHSDRKYTVNNIISESNYKKEILNKILPLFRKDDNWYGLAYEIFSLIYLDNDFKEYTFYLLHNQFVMLEDLSIIQINNILKHTSWGFDYIINNLDNSFYNHEIYKIIKTLVEYSKNDSDKYKIIKEKIFSLNNKDIRYDFIVASISKHINLDNDDIIASLYQDTNNYYYHQETLPFYQENVELINSKLPEFLLFHAIKNDNIREMMLNNFELFFKTESTAKMKIFSYFINELAEDIVNNYKDIYNLYLKQPTLLIDKYISILINNDLEEWLNNLIKEKDFSYITSGSTTSAFKIEDKVLKFSLNKHNINTVKDLFLLAPTETKVIYNSKQEPIMIVELQKYLNDNYNEDNMTTLDIEKFLDELDKQGYVVTDPNCLNKKFDNFGFLEDYHDANLGQFKSHEELPEWFKERPIVLYDIDLVYKKDSEIKKTFSL